MIYDPVLQDPIDTDPTNPPGMKPVILKSGGENLLGTFFQAGGAEKKPTVILLHGFPGNESNFDIAHSIRRFGWNVLSFHYRGSWGSGGVFSWNNAIEDVTTVIDSIKQGYLSEDLKVDSKKLIMVGHSMGGFFSAYSLMKGLVEHAYTLALFNIGMIGELIAGNPAYEGMALESLREGAKFFNSIPPEKLLKEMIDNADEWNLLGGVRSIAERNLFLLGAEYDQTAPTAMHFSPLINMLKKVSPEKKFGEILQTGHSFSDKRIAVSRSVVDWLSTINFQDQ